MELTGQLRTSRGFRWHTLDNGCQPYAPAAFTPRKYSWYSFLLEADSTPGPRRDRKDFMSMRNPVAGIEPATFRFVAQHLNHCATAVPLELEVQNIRVYLTDPILYFSQYLASRNTNCTNTHKCQRIARKKRCLSTERKKPIQHNEDEDGGKWSTVIPLKFRQTLGLFGWKKKVIKLCVIIKHVLV